jgi:hypothetical protein
LESALVVAIGLLLRFGLPLVLTLGLWWLLRELDRRWQAEARGSAPAVSEWPACWQVRGCRPDVRAKCPAGHPRARPCWQVLREVEGRLPDRCLACPVFRNATVYQP